MLSEVNKGKTQTERKHVGAQSGECGGLVSGQAGLNSLGGTGQVITVISLSPLPHLQDNKTNHSTHVRQAQGRHTNKHDIILMHLF